MTYEYATTFGQSLPDMKLADAPLPPVGDGWELAGSNVIADGHATRTALGVSPTRFHHFWYWRRRIDGRPCDTCGAVAKKNGRCLACEEPVT